MTPDEREMLAGLFQRVNANGAAPRDAQAEAFINDAVRAAPYAPYLLAQTVLVQQHALDAAAHRIAELEAAAHEAGQRQQEPGSFLGNLGRTIFGGGAQSAPPRPGYDPNAYPPGPPPQPASAPPPPSQYAPPRPGPWGAAPSTGGGGGFLQNAATTAAGVAGGVVLGNLLGGLFGGHSGGGLFGGSAFAGGVPTETINNFYEVAPDGSDQFQPNAPDDAGYIDDASFDDGSTFDDGSGGGGFDDV
jgi:hypothetical protein